MPLLVGFTINAYLGRLIASIAQLAAPQGMTKIDLH
jgi:hypothetical protein